MKIALSLWIYFISQFSFAGACCGGEEKENGDATKWVSEEALNGLRTSASSKEPEFELFGWSVFKIENRFYGVLESTGSLEFVATAVNKMDSELQLSGRSLIILDQNRRISVPNDGIVKLRGDKYTISGGRSRVTIDLPGANKAE